MNSLCVFCGSSPGANGAYADAARAFGTLLAEQHISLVFGGGKVGLMGHLADAVLSNGGKAIGVIPEALVRKEVAHDGLTTMHVVKTMHERKALMYDLSDAFVALPGGTGTLDELFEVITWNQLGYLTKPVGLLNVHGYFDALTAFLHHSVAERFVKPELLGLLHADEDPEKLLTRLNTPPTPLSDKWMDRS
jgi:uncharacterized protein (TIGR00730 family)